MVLLSKIVNHVVSDPLLQYSYLCLCKVISRLSYKYPLYSRTCNASFFNQHLAEEMTSQMVSIYTMLILILAHFDAQSSCIQL